MSSLVVPYSEIESVKLVNDLLNVIIDIETNTGNVRLTTQQKELSDIRLSGIYASQYAGGYKNWHAENVEATLKALSESWGRFRLTHISRARLNLNSVMSAVENRPHDSRQEAPLLRIAKSALAERARDDGKRFIERSIFISTC